MIRNLRAALVLLIGILMGAVIGSGLHEQGSLAYVVVDIADVTDPDAYKTVLENAPAGLLAFGGRYLIRSEHLIALDGVAPKRFVLIAFDSVEKAQRWSKSAPVKEITAIRQRVSTSRSFI